MTELERPTRGAGRLFSNKAVRLLGAAGAPRL